MKTCIVCGTSEAQKWYSGPTCRACYMKKTYSNRTPKYWADKANIYRRTERGSYNTTKGNAKAKGIEWAISFEEFKTVRSTNQCHYCEGALPEVCGGLDRKNNELGYIPGNLVPCCARCNYLKRDLLSYEETVRVIKLIKEMRNGKVWQL